MGHLVGQRFRYWVLVCTLNSFELTVFTWQIRGGAWFERASIPVSKESGYSLLSKISPLYASNSLSFRTNSIPLRCLAAFTNYMYQTFTAV
jgi:hypothetical protein